MTLPILSLCLLFNVALYANDMISSDLNEDSIVDEQQHDEPILEQTEPEIVEPQQADVLMPNTLNTLGADDSGNWVLKRVWWEKAEDAFGKIMALNLQIAQQQMEYFSARNEIDKELDGRKRELILTFDDLEKTITHLLGLVEKTESLGELDLKNDSFRASVLENKDQLIKLKDDLSKLSKLDSEMDQAIINVIDQVQKCNDYEARAWEDFKQIGRVLNDELAKSLYYQVVNYRKNIKMILRYLKSDLHPSFEGLMARAVTLLDEIKKTVVQLRENGIDLVYESKMIHEGARYSEQAEAQSHSQKPVKKTGIWGAVQNILGMLKDLVLWLPRKLFGLFGIKF
jgi:hypothetical protein